MLLRAPLLPLLLLLCALLLAIASPHLRPVLRATALHAVGYCARSTQSVSFALIPAARPSEVMVRGSWDGFHTPLSLARPPLSLAQPHSLAAMLKATVLARRLPTSTALAHGIWTPFRTPWLPLQPWGANLSLPCGTYTYRYDVDSRPQVSYRDEMVRARDAPVKLGATRPLPWPINRLGRLWRRLTWKGAYNVVRIACNESCEW